MNKFGILIITSFVSSITCLSCDCDYRHRDTYCGPVPTCPATSTLVLDPCGCCQICSKIEGEVCGGPWKIYGKCTSGLSCQASVPTDTLGAGGNFGNHHEPKGVCRKLGEVLQASRPCFVALKQYQTDIHIRGKRQAVTNRQPLSTSKQATKPTLNSTTHLLVSLSKTTANQSSNGPSSPNYTTLMKLLSQITTDSPLNITTGSLNMTPNDTITTPQSGTSEQITEDQTTVTASFTSSEPITTEDISFTSESSTEATTFTVVSTTDTDLTTESITTTPDISTEVFTTPTVPTTTPCPLKPRCTPEGWFAPTQCDPCVGECWCVYYSNGQEVSNTRKQGRVRCP
ncbi:Hypothetical predicted protein [Mytilus galloprovincialis]|uniref:IGFBP N-terminal domain-containing protein n=1 Tax=Mytilus galloprovincialis TaxID=29158 RepID=A0A8B6CFM4_MYTGA|nr:Hypothetical predicted protein [Mytilus galloprovincialis]